MEKQSTRRCLSRVRDPCEKWALYLSNQASKFYVFPRKGGMDGKNAGGYNAVPRESVNGGVRRGERIENMCHSWLLHRYMPSKHITDIIFFVLKSCMKPVSYMVIKFLIMGTNGNWLRVKHCCRQLHVRGGVVRHGRPRLHHPPARSPRSAHHLRRGAQRPAARWPRSGSGSPRGSLQGHRGGTRGSECHTGV